MERHVAKRLILAAGLLLGGTSVSSASSTLKRNSPARTCTSSPRARRRASRSGGSTREVRATSRVGGR